MQAKNPRKEIFFREGGRGEPPYPPYHKNLGCQGEIAKPGCQGKSFDANFLEKDLASLGSSAYAVRMKIEIDYVDLSIVLASFTTMEKEYESILSFESTDEKTKEFFREQLSQLRETRKKFLNK